MNATLVRVGRHVVNIEHVADAKWEGEKLYIHYDGGRFASFVDRQAQLIWDAICLCTVDLESGEAPPPPS